MGWLTVSSRQREEAEARRREVSAQAMMKLRAEPVVFLALVEQHLQRADAEDEHRGRCNPRACRTGLDAAAGRADLQRSGCRA